jgi:hypothetical protein
MDGHEITRREFVKVGTAGAAASPNLLFASSEM